MVGYKFIIDGRPYATFSWFDSNVKMKSDLQDWLHKHRCWDGADRGWNGWTDLMDLRPLCNYGQIDKTWLMFDWNHIHLGKAFRERFSTWKQTMVFDVRVHVPDNKAGEAVLEHHENWLKAFNYQEGNDWARSPCAETFVDSDNWLYSFSSKKAAAAFKLVFGV